jgi:ClpP class serine protease
VKRSFLPTDRALALYARSLGALFDVPDEGDDCFELCGAAAVVDILGPVVQHASYWDNYESITARVTAAATSSARAVVLRIDSPGGDALGMIECARAIRATCLAAGKPLFAFVDGMACSAAYALASSAGVIVSPPAGVVGSVGVYQPMVDATAQDKMMGLSYEMISSGDAKLDGNPHAPLSDAARARTQLRVDGLADLFFALVADMRPGVTPNKMRALEGATFLGAEALRVGLIDAVGTWDDVLALVASDKTATASATATPEETAMADEEKKDDSMKDDDAKGAKKAKAKKALFSAMEAAFDSMFEDDDDKDDEKKKKKEEGSASASEEDPKKKEDEKEESKASAATTMKLLARVHALEAERSLEKETAARASLLAQRPDFSAEVLATLATVPLAALKTAVETWPRAAYNPATAGSVTSTAARGPSAPKASAAVIDHITEKMGLGTPSGAAMTSEQGGFANVFQPISQEAAAARLAELTKKAVA